MSRSSMSCCRSGPPPTGSAGAVSASSSTARPARSRANGPGRRSRSSSPRSWSRHSPRPVPGSRSTSTPARAIEPGLALADRHAAARILCDPARDGDGQDAVLHRRLDLGAGGVRRQAEAAAEAAILPFAEVPGVALFLTLGLLFALHGHDAVVDRQFDVLLVNAR